jgi:hypothetical protein
MQTITLYRPVGQRELDLIAASGFRRFPPRLPHQPIFYPVLRRSYAEQIARDWNTKDAASGFVGYVLEFQVEKSFLDRYQVHRAGSSEHEEYWIPAEDLDAFNSHIVSRTPRPIEVIAEFRQDETLRRG